MGAWWWEVCWGLWLALGWAVLGASVSLTAWNLGIQARQKSRSGHNNLSQSLCRLDLGFHTSCILLAPSGHARLRSLRAFVSWTQNPAFWSGDFCYFAETPDTLADALAVCVLEDGPEAAPLLDVVWDSYRVKLGGGRLTAAGRERLFSEAFLGRLRTFFLTSEDPACQRAVLRLYGHLSCELLQAKWAAELPEALLPQLVWSGPGAPPVERHKLHLLRSQVARNQAFLRHPDFVASLRERLRGGDPGGLLFPAICIYSQDASQVPLDLLKGPGCYTSSGSIFLILPVFRDLLVNFDRAHEDSERFHSGALRICPTLRPEEAVAVVEGCVVPLLGRAEELPPAGLRCLASVFPTSVGYQAHSSQSPPLDPAVAAAGAALASRLRELFHSAVKDVLTAGRLNVSQRWALVGALWRGHDAREDLDLCRLLLRELLWLPVTSESRDQALSFLYSMCLVSGVRGSLAWGGGFVVLRRLIDLHQPPYEIQGDFDAYGSQLGFGLEEAVALLQSEAPGLGWGVQPPLEPAEATRRLLAWREAGAGPALRRLIHRQPPPGTTDIRNQAQHLLQLHDDLLRHHPLQTHSRLPHEIHFPDA